jgi:MFS family permease
VSTVDREQAVTVDAAVAPLRLRALLRPMSGLMIAQFVAALSATIVATSIPTITTTLEGPASAATWLVAATILGNTATTPIWGRLSDLYPPKRMVLCGILIFAIGSALAALSPSTAVLLGARALQGIGLAGIHIGGTVVIAGLVAPRERGRATSLLQSMNTTGTLLGPIVGGVIVEYVGWRWSFFVSLPVAAIAVAVILWTLPSVAAVVSGARTDYAGAALLATGIPAFLIALTMVGDDGFTSPALIFGGYGVLAIVALVIVELRMEAPVVPLRALGDRIPLLCSIAAFLLGSTMFGGSVFITQYLQLGLGIAPALAGLLLAPMAIGSVCSAWISGRLISRSGRVRPVLVLGASLILSGNVLIAISPLAPMPLALSGAFLLASGLGMGLQNLVLVAQTVAPPGRIGSVSSIIGFFFALGGTVGLVAYGAVFTARIGVLGDVSIAAQYALGMPTVFAVSAAAVLVGLTAILFLPNVRLRATL